MEKLDRIDTNRVPDGICQYGAQEKQVRSVKQHGYPIDFWDDQTAEAEETKLEAVVTWLVCLVLIGVAAYAMTL